VKTLSAQKKVIYNTLITHYSNGSENDNDVIGLECLLMSVLRETDWCMLKIFQETTS
jgi:hypothetical protein